MAGTRGREIHDRGKDAFAAQGCRGCNTHVIAVQAQSGVGCSSQRIYIVSGAAYSQLGAYNNHSELGADREAVAARRECGYEFGREGKIEVWRLSTTAAATAGCFGGQDEFMAGRGKRIGCNWSGLYHGHGHLRGRGRYGLASSGGLWWHQHRAMDSLGLRNCNLGGYCMEGADVLAVRRSKSTRLIRKAQSMTQSRRLPIP